ncbi:protein of unknown function [Legionella micdadei]|uniref:Uncharacterized protein n=3 Tax=Legionella micdadei TaxID=451 RepID=A0A098GDY4_LEGMI|nr:hypothetical protein Lmic_0350 [Legionella micdadei]CEG60202.1 protein of unknown function [Legionella micdadei]SCY63374.1 hypothetical protein SAMN02982997_02303 [Legionella micdadei]
MGKGMSATLFMGDANGNIYIAKKPRWRALGSIFKESLPTELKPYESWTYLDFRREKENLSEEKLNLLRSYFNHLKELTIEAAFGEIVYMKVAARLFPISAQLPVCFLHIESETDEPLIISTYLPDFNEFISKKVELILGAKVESAAEWDYRKKLSRADLKFTRHELKLLGKLYCLGLLMHDWDLVNNIMLANSGCIGDSETAKKISVVDGGNKFHFGFGGLTCEETALENRVFNPKAKRDDSPRGFNFTFPFDTGVFLTLPRMVIPDLFDLNDLDFVQGFLEMIEEARASINSQPSCIQMAVREAFTHITEDSDKHIKEQLRNRNSTLLNHRYYKGKERSGYILEQILHGRLHSLEKIAARLSKGDTVAQINQETQENYYFSQCW